jgi:hypothetical protein
MLLPYAILKMEAESFAEMLANDLWGYNGVMVL